MRIDRGVLVCLFAAAVPFAHGAGPTDSTAGSSGIVAPAPVIVKGTSATPLQLERGRPTPAKPDSWWWVHAGTALLLAGTSADVASSWKQPEGNPWLAQNSGPYKGKFYTSGAVKKSLLSAGLVSASYVLAKRWPKTRRFVGMFDMTIGAALTGVAANNVVQNPNLR